MMYETKFKINRAPLNALYRELKAFDLRTIVVDDPQNETAALEYVEIMDRIEAHKRFLGADAWNVFMKHGMFQNPESEYYNGNTIDWDRHIMTEYYSPQRDHMWVKFEITQKNVDAFYQLLEHLAPVLTTMTRFKMYREVAHKLMFLQLKGSGKLYPVLGYIKAYNNAEMLERGDGLADCHELTFDEIKSSDFKEWKKEGLDKFEFTLSVRDTPNFMKYYNDCLEMDYREYYEMTI